MPKPTNPSQISVAGVAAKKLVKVIKPYKKDLPQLDQEMVARAEATRATK
jgi:hypothetical protein